MGFAIAGMHYTAMAAMSFTPSASPRFEEEGQLLATPGLAIAVIIATVIILAIALIGSVVDRALSKRIEMTDVLEDPVKSRDEFLSVASHELKTPLTSVKLQTQLTMRRLSGDQELAPGPKAKYLKMLQQTDNRLIDDMLDISRITAGKLTLQVEQFDLAEMVTEVVERLSPLIFELNTSVRIECAERALGTWDRFRLEQVVTNLLTNAAKYGAGKPAVVSVRNLKSGVVLSIRDEGLGIAPENLERIFQRFERISSTEHIKGLGIGLFIVKKIIQMHRGEITVNSVVGEGSEFLVTLPLESVRQTS